MELHPQVHPPTYQIQSPICFSGQKTLFSGDGSYNNRAGEGKVKAAAIGGVSEKSHVPQLLGS